MEIKIFKNFMEPIGSKKGKTERIEYQLQTLGFRIYGSNFAVMGDFSNMVDLSKILTQLKKLDVIKSVVVTF